MKMGRIYEATSRQAPTQKSYKVSKLRKTHLGLRSHCPVRIFKTFPDI